MSVSCKKFPAAIGHGTPCPYIAFDVGGVVISLGTLFDPALPNAIVVRQTAYLIAGLIASVLETART
ncbi:hypothetical protein AGMMS49545_05650 [Betaproteobacteria bacterium]|nr:hypothetical protein AGMMS49545_05650 [Betaproteobacteria bacterium]GHU42858.1 hypothetical protein AGMMS50289_08270 [Betaproteobacteria bacterium]